MGHVAHPRSYSGILEDAEKLRLDLGMENIKAISPVLVLEILSIKGVVDYECCDDEDAPAWGEAFYDPSRNIIIIPDSVFIGASEGRGRDRFTISHELGHRILEHTATLARTPSEYPIYMDIEWQANTFASFFLAPPRLVAGYKNPGEVPTAA